LVSHEEAVAVGGDLTPGNSAEARERRGNGSVGSILARLAFAEEQIDRTS